MQTNPPPYNQPGHYPPQQGPPPQAGFYPPQHAHPPPSGVIITTPVIAVGGCPSCRAGVLSDEFTCCGILLAILFFPVGIICCWVMRSKRCTNCGATFD